MKVEKMVPGSKLLGQHLAELRDELGLTDRQIVTNTGGALTHGYISKLERGVTANPGVLNLVLIADGMGIPLLTLLQRLGFDLGEVPARAPPELIIVPAPEQATEEAEKVAAGYSCVPVIEKDALGRPGKPQYDHQHIKAHALVRGSVAGPSFCIEWDNDSMAPAVPTGSLVCVAELPLEQLAGMLVDAKGGYVLLARHEGEIVAGYLAAVQRVDGAIVIALRPANPNHHVIVLDWARPADCPVIGFVTQAWLSWQLNSAD